MLMCDESSLDHRATPALRSMLAGGESQTLRFTEGGWASAAAA